MFAHCARKFTVSTWMLHDQARKLVHPKSLYYNNDFFEVHGCKTIGFVASPKTRNPSNAL
jgi:hypothetical protein